MAMDPWITRQAAGARIDDLRRIAARDRLARDVTPRDRHSLGQPAAIRLAGEVLLRWAFPGR
ncbi:MAG: hypothetical protein ABSH07_06765 [Candidatus Dormibacteria bacterium]